MRHILTTITLSLAFTAIQAQTLNVVTGSVTTQFPATQTGDMTYTEGGKQLTICGKTYDVGNIDEIYIDESAVTDNTVDVVYDGSSATVTIAGNIASYVTAEVQGAHVNLTQSEDVADETCGEITYSLSGSTDNGELYMTGAYKATIELNGLKLTNQTPVWSGAAINIMNGKRIDMSVKKGTTNTLTDAANGGQKSALYCKGHLELKGKGTLNVNGLLAHAIKSGDYMSVKNCTVNVVGAVKDGISCNEYFLMESGTLNISGTGDDGIQVDLDGKTSTGQTANHEDEDTGNIYLTDGTLKITTGADGGKGLKAAGDVKVSGGKLTIVQTGTIVTEEDDISYPTSIKADGNVNITGGAIIIDNSADGGKGISADGEVTIDQSKATTIIDIKANGIGGTVETAGSATGGEEEQKSYRIYVSAPTSGGGGGPNGGGSSAWRTVYLYKADGTLVTQLTSTVNKWNGNSSVSFYYYDFVAADEGTYYFKGDNYTRGNTTYTILTETFSGPTSGSDVYLSITNSYTTSGTTRTYKLNNVTSEYTGSSESAEDEGTGYNATGIKADGNITISAGTVSVVNSGAMSKSIKSKATLTIGGGNLTLTPSGTMMVISGDASYSSAIKAVDFVQNAGTLTINASGQAGRGISATNITTNGGTLSITNSGEGVTGSSDDYTAKGMKADTSVKLNAGTITIAMTGTGGKGIKSKGTYTQGTSDGSGPTLTLSTTGSKLNASSGGGGGMGPGGWGMQTSGGGSAKGIKVQGTINIYGGTTEITTKTNGAEGLESKTKSDKAIVISGGKHYFFCYDDCINSAGAIVFDGGSTVCYSNGNDAVDSNYGTQGAITIGNGNVLAYTTKGAPEEGLDCDNNSYIKITGTGIGLSAGGAQGGGSSSSSISNAAQGYAIVTNTIKYASGQYYTLADSSGKNLVTYSLPAAINSTLSLFTATGMVKGSTYTLKSSGTEPTDATTAWHGLYVGSSAVGSTDVTSFQAK